MFEEFIKSGHKIFKLVCGAGNECPQDVERLVAIYSLAGCNIFDICAKKEILAAAKKGLDISGITNDRYICVSVGMKGDPHTLKAGINQNQCLKCGKCQSVCLNDAVKQNFVVNTQRCIGCGRCFEVCQNNAVDMYENEIDLKTILPELIPIGVDCIEFHAASEDSRDIDKKWKIINESFDGMLSICIDRLNLGNKGVLERIKTMIALRRPYTTIIQADGIPMSGSDDNYKTTLQAVAMAEIIQNAKLPVYMFISGGTNSKTAKLASLCGIDYKGIAIGSYARLVVKDFIARDDFYTNKIVFNKALDIAKNLVKESKKE